MNPKFSHHTPLLLLLAAPSWALDARLAALPDPEPGDFPGLTLSWGPGRPVCARATFDRHVGNFTREMRDTQRPGQVRIIEFGLSPEYFKMRLEDFERFLNVVAEMGATSIYWA